MKIIQSSLPGVLILEPAVFADDRGWFMETYNLPRYRDAGIEDAFVQDNHSRSRRGVVRGLHYQEPNAQGKLVRCTSGSLYDVAVDIRRGSPAFGKWVGLELSEGNRRMLWIPPGFAHGFCATSEQADLVYKCTSLWDGPSERTIAWNDPALAIDWPVRNPLLSSKDSAAPPLHEATSLPHYPLV